MKQLSVMMVVATSCALVLNAADQKAKFYEWMGSAVSNPFEIDKHTFCPAYTGESECYGCSKDRCVHCHAIPMLAVYNGSVKAIWAPISSYFSGGYYGYFDTIHDYFDKDSAHSYILTSSLIFKPSGTFDGLLTPRAATFPRAQYLQRINFKPHDDGSIRACDISVVDDPVCKKLTQGIGINWSLACATNPSQDTFMILLRQDEEKNLNKEFKLLIGGDAQKSCSYSNLLRTGEITDINIRVNFDAKKTAQYLQVTHRTEPEGVEEKLVLEYRLNEGKEEITCYEHVVAVDLEKPDQSKTVSLRNLWYPSAYDHIMSWPAKPIEPYNVAIKPQAQRVMHCYQPDTAWPREIFSTYLPFVRHILDIKAKKRYDDALVSYLESCSFDEIAKYFRVLLVSKFGSNLEYVMRVHCLVKRSPDATMYADADGFIYYSSSDDDLWNKAEQLDGPFFWPLAEKYVCDKWVSLLTKEKVKDDSEIYLNAHRPEALRALTVEGFKSLYTERAMAPAQRTWDNGKIGLYWWCDCKGLHLRLYDLKSEDKKLFAVRDIPDCSDGSVTKVEEVGKQLQVGVRYKPSSSTSNTASNTAITTTSSTPVAPIASLQPKTTNSRGYCAVM